MAKKTNSSKKFNVASQEANAMFIREVSSRVTSSIGEINIPTDDGRYSLILLLSGENLSGLDAIRFNTVSEAAHKYCEVILAKLYRLRYSKSRDPFTRFIKGWLSDHPESGLKRWIKRQILGCPELAQPLQQKEGTLGGDIRRRLVEQAAMLVNRSWLTS